MPTGDRTAGLLSAVLTVVAVSLGSAQAGPGTVVDLDRLGDPVKLEQQLRDLLRSVPGGIPADGKLPFAVANGRVTLGDFRLASGQSASGNLLVLQGNADLAGQLDGNIVVLDGDLVLRSGAQVRGDALVMGGRIRERGGSVRGEQRVLDHAGPADTSPGMLGGFLSKLAGLAGALLTLSIVGFGLVLFGQPQLETISDTVTHSLLRSFLAGLLAQVLVLPSLALMITGLVMSVVGILLVPFVVIVVPLLCVAAVVGGFIAVAHAIGEQRIRRRIAAGARVGSANSYRYVLLGLSGIAALWLGWILFGWVPLAGALVFVAASIATWLLATVGFGAALLSRGGNRPAFAGRYLPPEAMTDEYLWATPRFGVDAVKRPLK